MRGNKNLKTMNLSDKRRNELAQEAFNDIEVYNNTIVKERELIDAAIKTRLKLLIVDAIVDYLKDK